MDKEIKLPRSRLDPEPIEETILESMEKKRPSMFLKYRDFFKTQGLSHRQSEVASLVCTGLSNKDIAHQLFLSEKAVKWHLLRIYKRFQLKNRVCLTLYAIEGYERHAS